ncbi:uncharacterized protein LOC141911139 isoform X2 [Tubulanus polymorphus]|uniref:uncharacterized protein LOC141911139 isoform X2 n=1 Tax=Tubulanus polymorphus TaxID=672921 RepID=UPI003DA5E60E
MSNPFADPRPKWTQEDHVVAKTKYWGPYWVFIGILYSIWTLVVSLVGLIHHAAYTQDCGEEKLGTNATIITTTLAPTNETIEAVITPEECMDYTRLRWTALAGVASSLLEITAASSVLCGCVQGALTRKDHHRKILRQNNATSTENATDNAAPAPSTSSKTWTKHSNPPQNKDQKLHDNFYDDEEAQDEEDSIFGMGDSDLASLRGYVIENPPPRTADSFDSPPPYEEVARILPTAPPPTSRVQPSAPPSDPVIHYSKKKSDKK